MIKATVIVLGSLPWLDDKTLLLQTPHTLGRGQRMILHKCETCKLQGQTFRQDVLPGVLGYNCYGKTNHILIGYHAHPQEELI